MGRLSGKRAVITGATGGIGAASCRMFGREGAEVIGADIDAPAGAALEAELQAEGLAFHFVRTDVTDAEQVRGLAEHAAAAGPIDVVFANAGVILGKPLLQCTVEDWDRMHDLNARSVFLTITTFAPLMTNPGGSIIVTSRGGAVTALPNMAVYAASKASAMVGGASLVHADPAIPAAMIAFFRTGPFAYSGVGAFGSRCSRSSARSWSSSGSRGS